MIGSLTSREKSSKLLSQTLPKQATQVDNFFKESYSKFSSSPPRSMYHPKDRNPILTGESSKPKKDLKIIPIHSGPEKSKGKAMGQFYAQSKKSVIFAQPFNDFVPCRKVIQQELFEKPQTMSLKRAECQPERRDPILQETVRVTPVRVRDKNFESTAFEHVGNVCEPDNVMRKGKYFDHMKSNVFQDKGGSDFNGKKKRLEKDGEMKAVISYAENQGFRDDISVKDPNRNKVEKNQLAQCRVLNNNAESYKYREMQSGVL